MRKLNYSSNNGKGQQCVSSETSFDQASGLDGKCRTDLYKSIRPILLFGRLIGVLPLEGLDKDNHELLDFRLFSIKSLVSVLIISSLFFCVGVSIICLFRDASKTVKESVEEVNPILYYFMGLFSYVYMLWRIKQFRSLLETWKSIKVSFCNEDRSLKRDVWLIFGFIFTSAFFENLLQQSIQLTLLDWMSNPKMENFDPLHKYFYDTNHPNWSELFPYHVVLFVLIFIWNKLSLYAWNFVDIFLIIMSRALYFQFRALEKHTRENVVNFRGVLSPLQDETELYSKWQTVATDFETLLSLLNQTKQFLSPLVFTSYATNLFFVILHLHLGLDASTPTDDSTAQEIYKTWSFLHLLCRLYCLTLFASRIHDSADEFLLLFRKCPLDCYSLKVERVERSTISSRLGLTGLNCFVVTKPFMLSLVSVVLTFEIVLLQASGNNFSSSFSSFKQ